MGKLPSTLLRRPTSLYTSTSTTTTTTTTKTTSSPPRCLLQHQQLRHATFVLRPRRPYQFTQLVQLSDGSTFTVRTTMPSALYKSSKDSRNHVLWQPTEKSLRNIEVDEAGKLAAFRDRYGRGWDIDEVVPTADEAEAVVAEAAAAAKTKTAEVEAKAVVDKKAEAAQEQKTNGEDPFDSLIDLISSYSKFDPNTKGGKSAKDAARDEGKKKR
ncbi:hypothetical protein B0T25DRAFT_113386 [Lasiosphaeria hispida]|uniref:Ribosomal protein bL31m N-terminal domain-containing protein n=1 Tax=Lasiosphaeria hispida TaxID=260671 RepID=A0AAJ0MI80_9PEZI|nr:hypothetical protein B0T25DRAFT_113386 [Lasiosphaeria hispida]